MPALMVKWIIKALETCQSNLQLMLRFRLGYSQPYAKGHWLPTMDYFTLPNHQCHRGSLVWNLIVVEWKKLLSDLTFTSPSNIDELLGCSLWHCPALTLIGPGFSKLQASQLHRAGISTYKDIWDGSNFITAEAAELKFGLTLSKRGVWENACRLMLGTWDNLLRSTLDVSRWTSG